MLFHAAFFILVCSVLWNIYIVFLYDILFVAEKSLFLQNDCS